MALLSGANKELLSQRVFYFLCWLVSFSFVPLVNAQTLEKPLFQWLPFFTSTIQQFQPDQDCPQNKIINIHTDKQGDHLDIDIATLDWDLNCKAEPDLSPSPYALDSEKKEYIDSQLKAFFQTLQTFSETTIKIKAVNLAIEQLHKTVTFSISIKKSGALLTATLSGEEFDAQLTVNMDNKQLTIETKLIPQALDKFIVLPSELKGLLNNPVKLTYQSDLTDWGKGSFALNSQGQLAALAEQIELTVAGEVALLKQQLSLNKMAVNLNKVSYQISPEQVWQSAYINIQLAEPSVIALSPLSVAALPLHSRIGRSILVTNISQDKSARSHIDKQKIPPLFAAVNAHGSLQNITMDWRLALLNQTLTGEASFANNKLKAQVLNNHLSPPKLVNALRSYLPELQLMNLNSGDIIVQLAVTYDLKTKIASLDSSIKALEIAGKNDDVDFDGVIFNSQLHYQLADKRLIKKDKMQLKIANLFVGIPIQALQLDAQVNGGEFIIDHFKARLLGGRVDLANFTLTPSSQSVIKLSGLSLTELFKYSAYPEIESKGIIDGILPLSFSEQGPEIKNGVLSARYPGGYIRVPENTVVEAMSKDNPAFSFTMKALSDLQFTSLQGKLDYSADGESDLQVEIEGINPNISKTRAIAFNYSHNENILKLLKSLRFNEQLTKQIEEKY